VLLLFTNFAQKSRLTGRF